MTTDLNMHACACAAEGKFGSLAGEKAKSAGRKEKLTETECRQWNQNKPAVMRKVP